MWREIGCAGASALTVKVAVSAFMWAWLRDRGRPAAAALIALTAAALKSRRVGSFLGIIVLMKRRCRRRARSIGRCACWIRRHRRRRDDIIEVRMAGDRAVV